MSADVPEGPRSELILFRADDPQTHVQVRLEGDTVCLRQLQLADLYEVSVKTISEHLQNVYSEGELEPERTIRKFRIVQIEGSRQVERDFEEATRTVKAVEQGRQKPARKSK